MGRRYPSPRQGTMRPDVILVHSDQAAASALIQVAAARNVRIVMATDAHHALIQVRQWRAPVLVVPLADVPHLALTEPGMPVILAAAGAAEPAATLIAALRAGVSDLMLVEDPPSVWVDRLIAAIARRRDLHPGSIAESLSRLPELPEREIWHDLLLREALRRSGMQVSVAARLLGMTRQALHRHLVRLTCQRELTADSTETIAGSAQPQH